MTRYGTTTVAPPADVFRMARQHFTGRSAGLRIVSQSLDALELRSSLGTVRIEAQRAGDETEVTILSREHDVESRAFLYALPRASLLRRWRARIRG